MTITVETSFGKSGIETFEELIASAYEMAMQIGRDFVVKTLEAHDRTLMETRDRSRFRGKGKQRTSIKTKLGVIEYSRNVYVDRSVSEGIKCVHLLDEDLGIEKIGQIAKDVCEAAANLVCESSYRASARAIAETTGLSISAQGVWNIVQALGTQRREQIELHAQLAREHRGLGCIVSKVLYEENDGVYLKLQGKSREQYGPSKEMKVGIAYDGATVQTGKGGKQRRTLDCKVAHASFEPAQAFREHKEGVIASRFDVDEVELRIINGDGANWIQKKDGTDCICVLDRFHRNKKLTECIKDKDFLETARALLFSNRIDDLLTCIAAQIDSTENEEERDRLRDLLMYYTENKDAMLSPYERGIKIPETREPGVIHHARLGSMESNIFTLIGNRMKGRRCCWSIRGGDNLAAILCEKYTNDFSALFSETIPEVSADCRNPLSAAKAPRSAGSGYECYSRATIPNIPWLRDLTGLRPFTDFAF